MKGFNTYKTSILMCSIFLDYKCLMQYSNICICPLLLQSYPDLYFVIEISTTSISVEINVCGPNLACYAYTHSILFDSNSLCNKKRDKCIKQY